MANITSDMLRAKMRRLTEDVLNSDLGSDLDPNEYYQDGEEPDDMDSLVPAMDRAFKSVNNAQNAEDFSKVLMELAAIMRVYGGQEDAHMSNMAMLLDELTKAYKNYVVSSGAGYSLEDLN